MEEVHNEYVASGEYRGHQWRVWRDPDMGHLCGYVSKGWSLVDYYFENSIEVHGGITYDDGFWVGFDCAHSFSDPEICDVDFCINECTSMIDQIEGPEKRKRTKKRKNRSRYKKHLNTIRVALEELTEYSEELTPEQLRMGASELREELEKLDAEHRKSIAALRKK
jgi:hypothetical protein